MTAEVMSFAEAVENAVRVLKHAEGETNLAAMERMEHLADSWLGLARMLLDREHV